MMVVIMTSQEKLNSKKVSFEAFFDVVMIFALNARTLIIPYDKGILYGK